MTEKVEGENERGQMEQFVRNLLKVKLLLNFSTVVRLDWQLVDQIVRMSQIFWTGLAIAN